MTKYKEYFERMLRENKDDFDRFTKVHLEYSIDQEKNQEEFNSEGEKILEIIRVWEDRLCKTSEKAGYGTFTGNLAEKFRAEIKSHFPLIEHIGIVTKKFEIKKISL